MADVVLSILGLGMLTLIGFAVHLILQRIDALGQEVAQLRVQTARLADRLLVTEMRLDTLERIVLPPAARLTGEQSLWGRYAQRQHDDPVEGA